MMLCMKTPKLSFTATITLVCLIFLPALHGATCTDDKKILAYKDSVGRNGGKEWDDRQNALDGGLITKIEIWAGKYVDGIEVTYGDGRKIPPVHHGGYGGEKHVLNLKPGDVITQVKGRAAKYVDQICFYVNGNESNTCYGRTGGDPFAFSASGLPLRSFKGRSDTLIDQLAFAFGNQTKIDTKSIKFDQAELDNQVAGAKTGSVEQTVVNNSGIKQKITYSKTNTLTHATSMSWKNEVGETLSHQLGTKIAFVAGNATKQVGFELSYTFTKTNSITTTNEQSRTDQDSESNGWSVEVEVPAHTKLRATTTWRDVSVDFNYSYNLLYLNANEETVCEVPVTNAIVHGKDSFAVEHKYETLP